VGIVIQLSNIEGLFVRTSVRGSSTVNTPL
jgi:hypothetical protein